MLYCLLYISSQTNNTHTHGRTHSTTSHTLRGQTFSPGSARCALLLSHTKAAVEVSIRHVCFSLHPGGKRVSIQQLSWLLKYCVVIVLFAKRIGAADRSSKLDLFAPQDNPPPSPTQMRRSTSFRPPSLKRKSRRRSKLLPTQVSEPRTPTPHPPTPFEFEGSRLLSGTRLLLFSPAVLPQTDQNSRSGSSLHALKSKSHDPQHAKATTPLPETSTHKPRPTEAVILDPRIAPTLKKDQVLISECDPRG